MDRFIIKRDLYGLHKRACCFLIALLLLLLAGCGEQTKETDSKKEEATKNPSKSESSEASQSWREDEEWQHLTRTWISEPTETVEQKMYVIENKACQGWSLPEPIKIENFVNTPQNLYAVALFKRDDIYKHMGEEEKWYGSESAKIDFDASCDEDLENRPKWYDISWDDYDKCVYVKMYWDSFNYREFYDGAWEEVEVMTILPGYAVFETDDPEILRAYFFYDNGLDEYANHPECYMD